MTPHQRIMAHMVAFFPDRAGSLQVARGLVGGGCSYLEIQFPFSDPTADGPDIQAACTSALEAGFTIEEGFRLAAEISRDVCKEAGVPIFLMSYANLLFTHGVEKFLTRCADSGIRGVIVPDLPPDYDEGLFDAAKRFGLHAVPVVSPSMRQERLERIGALRPAFIYATLRTGTTGSLTRIDEHGLSFLARVRALDSESPAKILGGFGISTPAQVSEVAPHAHAVVVGSAFVREVAKGGDLRAGLRRKMEELAGAVGRGAVAPAS